MMRRRVLAALVGAAALTLTPSVEGLTTSSRNAEHAMTATMRKLSPVLLVEQIEPALPFWIDRLGFQKTVEVPEGDKLGFVILEKDGVEVMYQTRASMKGDIPGLAGNPAGGSFLFIEVSDVAEVERALRGVEITVPRRKTPYGMDEVGVREPGGNVVLFAQPVQQGG